MDPRHPSLKLRLLLIITGILFFGIAIGVGFVIWHARQAVQAESASNLMLVRQMIGLARVGPGDEVPQEALENIAATVSRLRHVWVILEPEKAEPPPEAAAKTPVAPGWFVEQVMPPADMLPRLLLYGPGKTKRLVIQADPADEIQEAWEEAQPLMLIAAGTFLLVCGLVYLGLRRGLRPLDDLVAAFEKLERDDFSVRVSEEAAPELSRIHRRFNHMAEVLGQARQQNQLLANHLVNVQEEERRHLAREIHDDVAPHLFGVKVHSSTIHTLVEQQRYAEVAGQLRAIDDTVGQLQTQVRAILKRLRPPTLDELGLEEALSDLVEGWRMRCADTHWTLEITGPLAELDDILQITTYRVVQECLTNIARHADAHHAFVNIAIVPETCLREAQPGATEAIEILVRDDGRGMSQDTRPGLGMTGLQERVQALGGVVTLSRLGGQGLCMLARIPIIQSRLPA